jgi:hypothetical protein
MSTTTMNGVAANGVPWLRWLGETGWECDGCGASGCRHGYASVRDFARWLGDKKRAHAGCGETPCPVVGGVGDPLNPDRAER